MICVYVNVYASFTPGSTFKINLQKLDVFCECCALTRKCGCILHAGRVQVHLFLLRSSIYNHWPAVFSLKSGGIQSAARPMKWLQITLNSPSLCTALAEVKSATAESECRFLPQSVLGIDFLPVRRVDGSNARHPFYSNTAVFAAWLRKEASRLLWALELRYHTDLLTSLRDKSSPFAPSLH